MIFGGVPQRNFFRFLITPTSSLVTSETWFPLSDSRVPAAFWNLVRSDGGDIRVYLQDGVTQVPRELVGFNATTKVGSLFIKVNSGTAFYIYFGNRTLTEPAANSTYGRQSVWETAAKVVIHGFDVTDSSAGANGNTSATPPTVSATGPMNTALSFNGSNQFLSFPDGSQVDMHGDLTMFAWVDVTDFGNYRTLWSKCNVNSPNPLDSYFLLTTGKFTLQRGNGVANLGYTTPGSAPTAGTWAFVVATQSGTTVQHYLNGATNGASGTVNTATTNGAVALLLGKRADGATIYKGLMAEPRIYGRALSSAEIAQHYANQNAPGTFWASVGTVQQV